MVRVGVPMPDPSHGGPAGNGRRPGDGKWWRKVEGGRAKTRAYPERTEVARAAVKVISVEHNGSGST